MKTIALDENKNTNMGGFMKATRLKNMAINLIFILLFVLIGFAALVMNSCTRIETVELIKTDTVYVYTRDTINILGDTIYINTTDTLYINTIDTLYINIIDTIYIIIDDIDTITDRDPIIYDGPVIDASGNEYETVRIGTQVWMASNLRTLKYNNGNDIPTTNLDLRTLVNPAYYFSHTQTTDVTKDGYYYTWYTLNDICPMGYHVPDYWEWKELEDYVQGSAKALASTTGWTNCIYETTVGYNQHENNTTGFNALPVGRVTAQYWGIAYSDYTRRAQYWTSTENNDELKLYAYMKTISYDRRLIQTEVYPKNWSFNVRCIKN